MKGVRQLRKRMVGFSLGRAQPTLTTLSLHRGERIEAVYLEAGSGDRRRCDEPLGVVPRIAVVGLRLVEGLAFGREGAGSTVGVGRRFPLLENVGAADLTRCAK